MRASQNTLTFVRGIVLIAAGLLIIFSLELALDLVSGGYPLTRITTFSVADARHINNIFNRNLNQLMAIVFTTVGLAVPLTANLYSLKFLEFFIQDRVNAVALLFVVFADVANSWAGYAIRDNLIPVIQLNTVLVLTVLSFALVFPYLYYVFRFLHPNTLLTRLEHSLAADLAAARRRPGPRRAEVAANLEHVANIALRSVERGDRNTAIESVQTLNRALRHYWTQKPALPAAWFEADPDFFLGFSSSVVDDLNAHRSWVEMKVYNLLQQIVGAAIGRMPELTRTAAKALRHLSLEPAARQDPALRELATAFFNTLLRQALNRRDARAVFTVFDQYRLFAEAINGEQPELGLEIAYYFQYYGQVARETGQNFLAEAAAYDLGGLVRMAWEAGAANRAELLERFLHYDTQTRPPLKGVKKAQALLASFFLQTGEAAPAAAIQAHWAGLETAFIQQVRDELLFVRRETYWEITERRLNLEYVPPEQRPHLQRFFDGVLAA